MLNERLAADLVDRLSMHLDFNINIMDDRGVIIASRDRNRVGAFHAAAYRIVTGNESIEVLHPEDDLPPGVKAGVNLPITHHGKTVGVVGITGNPAEVLNLAYALKTSIESIYEYEMYKARMERRQGIKDLFQNLLLHDAGNLSPDLESVAEKLGYSNRFLRAPVILRFSVETDTGGVVAVMKRMPCHSRQDITFITATHDILVFKTVDPGLQGAVAALRQTIADYVAQLRAALAALADDGAVSAADPADFTVCVGSLQHDFRKYKAAFAHALWLVGEPAGSEQIRYFTDHIYRYVRSTIPGTVFEGAFSGIVDSLPEPPDASLCCTIEALLRGNMSLKEASGTLGVHRNTMRARVERISRTFGIDPVNRSQDREFLLCLNEYLKMSER